MDHHLTTDYESIRLILCESIQNNNCDVIKDILTNSPLRDQLLNPSYRRRDNDPLCKAIRTDRVEIVQLFLDLGAKIDSYDYVLVCEVICWKNDNILELFIDRGLDLFVKMNVSELIR